MLTLFTHHRKGIAMIELIFAIVVMGIAMLSAPMMLTTATKSSQVTFQQESIAVAATHINALLTYAWDEQNTDAAFASTLNILSTDSATTALDRNTTLPSIPMLRRKSSLLTSASVLGNDTNETLRDDIDDFNGYNNSLTLTSYGAGSVTGENEYMDININIQTTVDYGPDRSSAGASNFNTCSNNGCTFSNPFTTTPIGTTTNVKRITTTLTSNNVADKQITLKAFVCNIGIARPLSKVF
jgi:hypothetical protein